MRTWQIIVLLVVLVVVVLSMTVFSGSDKTFDATWAKTTSAPITMTIETNGTVEPLTTVLVGCEVTGKIIELLADLDEPVQKDQVICRIDPELMAAENEQSKADFAKAQSAVADAKLARDEQIASLPVRTKLALANKMEAEAALLDAEYNWKWIEGLQTKDSASPREYSLIHAQYLRARAVVSAAEANHELAVNNEVFLNQRAHQAVTQAEQTLNLAKARLDFTSTRVERCTIKSPIDGIVLKRYYDVGTTVNATFQTPTLFLLAPRLDRMQISAKVSESDISHIEVDQVARFTVEAKQRRHFEGKIINKHNQPDIIQNVVTYTVVFEVENPDGALVPGLSVDVKIECVAKSAVTQIANAALRFKPPLTLDQRRELISAAKATIPPRPDTDSLGQPAAYCDEAIAWTLDEETTTWKAVALWIGITDNINTEILAGAKTGDRFVRKFVESSDSGFSLKEALNLASPDNRTL